MGNALSSTATFSACLSAVQHIRIMMSIVNFIIPHMRVEVFTHNFCVSKISPRGKEICNAFARKYVGYTWEQTGGVYNRVPNKVFASSIYDRSEYRFHIHTLTDFKTLLRQYQLDDNLIEWIIHSEPVAKKVDIKIKPGWAPREHQLPVIEHLANSPCRIRIAELKMGEGKTASSLFAIKKIGLRVCVVVAAKYLLKWVDDFKKLYDCTNEDILLVQGSMNLKALLEISKEPDFNALAIIVSSTTYRNWIVEYEKLGKETLELGYATTPDKFFEHIGAGVRLIDECHQDFHFYFKLDCYTNVQYSISLSATLISNDPFLSNMYKVMFPLHTRLPKSDMKKYIDVCAIHFNFKDPFKLKTSHRGRSDYSHTALEEGILKHKPTAKNYYELIDKILEHGYFRDKKDGDKAIIFAATVEMCTRITQHLSAKYKDLDIRRYAEKDPYINVLEPDIRVTTIGSGGTAVDIPNLSCSIMTTAIDSVQANLQALGRLRERPNGLHCRFFYFVADNIEQHVKYHNNKRETFKDYCKSMNDLLTGAVV